MDDARRVRARIEAQVAARRAAPPGGRRPRPYPTPGTTGDGDPQPPGTPLRSRKGVRKLVRSLVRPAAMLAVVAVVAFLVHTYVLAQYYIPSGSMEPTLHGCAGCNDDHVLVDKLSYHLHDVHRGDVVVFHRPPTWHIAEDVLIKRVVGLAGDRLQVKADGALYINGVATDEPYLNAACGPMKAFRPLMVPDGQVFVLGDNRCDSSDSRVWGPVPESEIIGRAFVVVWPLGRIHWL